MWGPNRGHVCFLGLEYFWVFFWSSKSCKLFWLPTWLTGCFEKLHGLKTCQNCFGVVAVSDSTCEAPKISESFPPSFRWFLPAGWSGRVPRCNTAACSSRKRPRWSGPAAPRGQGGRGCQGRRRPWPQTRIFGETSWGMDCCEEVETCWWLKFLMDILHFFGKVGQKNCTNTVCFRGVYVSCTLSVQTSRFLLTILVLPCFGATIAIQNWSQHFQHCPMDPDILTLTSKIVWFWDTSPARIWSLLHLHAFAICRVKDVDGLR